MTRMMARAARRRARTHFPQSRRMAQPGPYYGVVLSPPGEAIERAPAHFTQMRMEEGLLHYMQGSPDLRLPEAYLAAQGFELDSFSQHTPEGCFKRAQSFGGILCAAVP